VHTAHAMVAANMQIWANYSHTDRIYSNIHEVDSDADDVFESVTPASYAATKQN